MEIAFLVADTAFLLQAALTVSLAFLVGLEFHNYQNAEGQGLGFGTARTLTLVGLAGFLLSALDKSGILYALGLVALCAWLGLYYRRRLEENYASLMAPIVGLLVYLLGLLAANAPPWFVAAYAIFIIFFLNAKPRIRSFADMFSGAEIATVAKFVIMAGIILPLLPDRQIADFIPVTFRDTWFAVLAVSGISYLSYVLRTYVFKSHGLMLAGLLGGLYSSTATTFLLGSQARSTPTSTLVSPALVLATSMMYVRLFFLAVLLAPASILELAPPFIGAMLLSLIIALALSRLRAKTPQVPAMPADNHPLEFQVALLFALLYVAFATATQFVLARYNTSGLQAIAFAIGFTEIDPFVLSVLSGHMQITLHAAVDAVIIATASNNLLKVGIALVTARNRSVLPACISLVAIAVLSFIYVAL